MGQKNTSVGINLYEQNKLIRWVYYVIFKNVFARLVHGIYFGKKRKYLVLMYITFTMSVICSKTVTPKNKHIIFIL